MHPDHAESRPKSANRERVPESASVARENKRPEREYSYRLLVHGLDEYALFMLDPAGHVVTWNPGAERIKGYRSDEILGRYFSVFYPRKM